MNIFLKKNSFFFYGFPEEEFWGSGEILLECNRVWQTVPCQTPKKKIWEKRTLCHWWPFKDKTLSEKPRPPLHWWIPDGILTILPLQSPIYLGRLDLQNIDQHWYFSLAEYLPSCHGHHPHKPWNVLDSSMLIRLLGHSRTRGGEYPKITNPTSFWSES